MTTAAKLREMLFNARDYMLRKEAAGEDITKQPKFDIKLEALIPVLKKEIPLKAHAHRSDDIMTAIRIAREFDLKITIEHCTEGHLIVNELKAANVPVAVGPTLTNASKLELLNKFNCNFVQGFLRGKPMPYNLCDAYLAGDVNALLKN